MKLERYRTIFRQKVIPSCYRVDLHIIIFCFLELVAVSLTGLLINWQWWTPFIVTGSMFQASVFTYFLHRFLLHQELPSCFREHLPAEHPVMELSPLNSPRRRHIAHHSKLKNQANFVIVAPPMDYLFKTKFTVALLVLGLSQVSISQDPLHSHNDYVQPRYLEEALENNFQSIEVDVWLNKGEVKVSHMPWNFKGNLDELYLKPLQKMVDEKKIKAPFLLWIDIKAFSPKIVPKLAELLKQYPMVGREVRVILTGRKKLKRKILEKYPELPVERDENSAEGSSSSNFTWYTLKWDKCTSWKGDSPLPAHEFENLKKLVEKIHGEGRKLRFYASPENEEYWKTLKELKVDLIDTDNIPNLKRLWDSLKDQKTPVN